MYKRNPLLLLLLFVIAVVYYISTYSTVLLLLQDENPRASERASEQVIAVCMCTSHPGPQKRSERENVRIPGVPTAAVGRRVKL